MSIFGPIRLWKSTDYIDSDFLQSYRTLLAARYADIPRDSMDEKTRKEIEEVLSRDSIALAWEDLYGLELTFLKVEPEAMVRRRSWSLRSEYAEIASASEQKDYLASKPPGDDSPIDSLRSDLICLQEEINWRYTVTWVLEEYRKQLVHRLLRGALAAILTVIGLTFWSTPLATLSTLTGINVVGIGIIVLSGMSGGLISTVRRIQAAKFGNNADIDLTQMSQGKTSIYVSPVLGAAFALVLFFLFAGSFLKGSMFPDVSFEMFSVKGLDQYRIALSNGSIARLVIWSFIAGFAESFVPDSLQRIVQSSQEGKR